ncbi:carboxylesterase/lipase family protein [Mucilaginibacter humi]|uniref:hypothetical protein n=1 Tax=Mucilaginibacter humi TaxID=2732510 RepID=UPI001C2E0FAA|nr:hypothetical protein [Mucilaginibacter humi]
MPLAKAEENGVKFATEINAKSLVDLRKISADTLLKLSTRGYFPTTIDGYFLPESPQAIFSTGRQMDVPLLAGWTTAEVGAGNVLGRAEPTVENYKAAVQKLYGDRTEDILKVYPANTDADVLQVATDPASDRFIAYATSEVY